MLKSKKAERKRKDYIPYIFASQCPEPCLVNQLNPNDEETNKSIKEDETNLYFMVTNFKYLNEHALRVMADLAWRSCSKTPSSKISRVKQSDPYFGKKWYAIRYVGCFGDKSDHTFLISEEDEDIFTTNSAVRTIIPGRRYISLGTPRDTCNVCGSEGVRFKLKPNSPYMRCGICLGLHGLKKSF